MNLTEIICPHCRSNTQFDKLCSNCAFNLELTSPLYKNSIYLYNKSIEYYKKGDPISAIQQIYSAISLFPYTPFILEYGILLTIEVGLLEVTLIFLELSEKMPTTKLSEKYSDLIKQEIDKWNNFIRELKTNRAISKEGQNFRQEFVIERIKKEGSLEITDYSDDTIQIIAKNSQFNYKRVGILVSLLFLITALIAGFSTFLGPKRTDISESSNKENIIKLKMINNFLLEDEYDSLLIFLSNIDHKSNSDFQISGLKKIAMEELWQTSKNAFLKKNYDVSFRYFTLIKEEYRTKPGNFNYYLGLSAYKCGRINEAIAAFDDYLKDKYLPHYYEEAALYYQAISNKGRGGKKYADLLRKKFPKSIYINSKIKAIQ